MIIDPYSAEIFVYSIKKTKGFFQFEIINSLVSSFNSASFEYLCYAFTAVINILLFPYGDRA